MAHRNPTKHQLLKAGVLLFCITSHDQTTKGLALVLLCHFAAHDLVQATFGIKTSHNNKSYQNLKQNEVNLCLGFFFRWREEWSLVFNSFISKHFLFLLFEF